MMKEYLRRSRCRVGIYVFFLVMQNGPFGQRTKVNLLMFIFVLERERERLSNAYNSQGLIRSKPGAQAGFPHRWQGDNHRSHHSLPPRMHWQEAASKAGNLRLK